MLAEKIKLGESGVADQRWNALARAYWLFADRNPDVGSLIPDEALAATASDAPRDLAVAVFRRRIDSAQREPEFIAAVEGAVAFGDNGALPAIARKLRDTSFGIGRQLETLLALLVGPADEGLLQSEIDGDNPFGSRRDALARVLATSRTNRAG